MQDDQEVNPRCPRVLFSEDEIRRFYKPWSKALIVKVLERSFSFLTMKKRLESLWARSGNIQVTDAANAFFLVRFSDEDDYKRAAFGGPWKIYDYYITVARWTPTFNEEEPIKSILTWVRLPRLPIHYFNELAVTRIGNHIGRTVRLDMATAEGARARYARVCVEVDISKPLLGKYMIDNRMFYIEYESLENICFTCGFYGHKSDDCLLNHPSEATAQETGVPEAPIPTMAEPCNIEGDAGTWMTVQRRTKGKKQEPISNPKRSTEGGSRFNILSHDEDAGTKAPPSKSPGAMQKEVPADFVGHAEKLAEILRQDEGSKEGVAPFMVKSNTKTPPREPLSNVTNRVQPKKDAVSGSDKKTKEGKESSPGLISVPVTYVNPIFMESVQGKAGKITKGGPRKGKPASIPKPASQSLKKTTKDGKPIRCFTSQSKTVQVIGNEGEKVGDPPDRS
ncbi:hypothetical protein LINPERPRIM_LOCUS3005 [Linum perenne]